MLPTAASSIPKLSFSFLFCSFSVTLPIYPDKACFALVSQIEAFVVHVVWYSKTHVASLQSGRKRRIIDTFTLAGPSFLVLPLCECAKSSPLRPWVLLHICARKAEHNSLYFLHTLCYWTYFLSSRFPF